MPPESYRRLRDLEGHLREVATGYRSGTPDEAGPSEPKVEYLPSVPKMERYAAKAQEVGISVPTLRRLMRRYRDGGIAALVDGRQTESSHPFGRVDQRWIDMAMQVLAEHVDASQPPMGHVAARVDARVQAAHGDEVRLPSASTAQRVLKVLNKGRSAFSGQSAKQKRSIADRPTTPYGSLRSTRLGQFILLDTTPLDVYAMDPITLRWEVMQLTVAMDLASRCIVGMRLSPVSAKAIDASMVLYETLHPGSRVHTSSGVLPYAGLPDTVYMMVNEHVGLPGVAPECVLIDHGKMYMSELFIAVCERLGISIQPARLHTPTDKSPLERFFRSLREDLLAALPGYKGPDVYSRGKNVEDFAFYFSDELEGIIRDWLVTRYHQRPHAGLCEESVPGLDLSPADMWDVLTARSPGLVVPSRSDLVYDFLPVEWRTIQHYGVEAMGLRFDGPGLEGYRNLSSPYASGEGKWPIRYDPQDARQVFFQRPDDNSWHALTWKHAKDFPEPFSDEALRYARRLAVAENRGGDDRAALAALLERWDAGLLHNPTERRMALRLSERRAAMKLLEVSTPVDGEPEPRLTLVDTVAGDDDCNDDFESAAPDEPAGDDFYSDALAVGE
jgi:transposase InsO family protein